MRRCFTCKKRLISRYFPSYSITLALLAFTFIFFCVTIATPFQVKLEWNASEGPIDGYRVFMREDWEDYNYDYPEWKGSDTTCTIDGLAEDVNYHFVVRSFNEFGESRNSNEVMLSFTPATSIWFEAEDGYTMNPMQVASDDTASAGEYLWVPNGQGNGGYAEYHFQVPEAGKYVIWGKVLAVNGRDDSFLVSLDNGGYNVWDTQCSKSWVWDQVSHRGGPDPVVYYLREGKHTLIIKQREDGTKIDKILVTKDMGYVPNS